MIQHTTSKIEKKQIVKILFLSKGDQPGKSRLIANINNTEYHDYKTISLDCTYCNFIDGNYKLIIYDTPTNDRFIPIYLPQVKRFDIVIYTIDLDNESLINESFINSIKEEKKDVIIYVVGNKLDKIEEKDMTKQILEKFRNQASDLIKQNKINQ